ncbi:acyltransferase [Trichlorobacter lovleyi]|uniref:Acetyltransferase (Isoleucine patch superfamily)-like protein n=1 Tax=Trichlorobacter lovleyi (strain ATCC BAA-1151 / DSM 17278 / SZ) TaxID=398767 RepID=B3E8V1_TRIL1|nr:acyltransferase [Trichlorobacter lovleyi]ACD95219.1 Acetyltransferase (isoleucine patch superfamily)-like protein [Trichlorobacter lovleyi SZ]
MITRKMHHIVSYIKNILSIKIVNLIFQKFFLIDSDCPYLKNYTSRVLCGKNLEIENNSVPVLNSLAVSGGCYIHAYSGIKIGEGTIWSFNVSMVSLDHDLSDYNKPTSKGSIVIGRNCWIGAGAVILSGVVLGDRTIVGANSVVNKSFPQGNVIIAGSPARIIKEL